MSFIHRNINMNENTNPSHYNDDEIDLKDLLKKIIGALERGTKIIFLSVLLGAILGLGYFFRSPVTFQSSLVLSSNILKIENIQALFNPIGLLLDEGNLELLGQEFQVNDSIATGLQGIEVASIFEKESENEEEVSYFEITATVRDSQILPELQKGIIHYLENNEFVKKRVELNQNKFETLIKQVDNELKEIDLLKKRIEEGGILSSGGSNVVLMEPSNLFEQSLLMMEKKQKYIESLALVQSIDVVKGFTPFNDPSSPSWTLCLVVGLAGGLIIGFAVIFFKEMDRYVRG